MPNSKMPTGSELYATLWDNVNRIRDGEISPSAANAVSNSIGKMFTAVKIQMEYAKITGAPPKLPPFLE